MWVIGPPRRRRGGPPSDRDAPETLDEVGGLAVATAVRRTRIRSVSHSACHAPSARSSTCSAAQRCKVAASRGVVRAARRIRTDSTGLALCGMDDDPPPRASESSPISGRLSSRTSRARCPQTSVVATRTSPARVTGRRWVCQDGDGSPVRAAPPREPRPARCRRDRRPAPERSGAARSAPASSSAVRQPRTLSPKVIGSAHCVSVRPIMGLAPCSSDNRTSAARALADVVADRRHRVAQQQHEGGVDDVLAGEAGVDVEVGMGRAQRLDQGDDGVARRPPRRARRPVPRAARPPRPLRRPPSRRGTPGR